MKKTKRFGCGLLAAALCAGLLTGCGAPAPAEIKIPQPETAKEETARETPDEGGASVDTSYSGFTEFDSTLIAFLEDRGYDRENFMVSPVSFRAALALAVSGADGETKDALLRAMGFSSVEEVAAWYAGLTEGVDAFQADLEQERQMQAQFPEEFGDTVPDRAYSIVNSVWHNADKPGAFRADYVRQAAERFGAVAAERSAAELTGAVNDWVNEATQGMIPAVAGDLSKTDAVLVNALYLRTSWINAFLKAITAPGAFTTLDGETVEKQFMRQQEKYAYYEDDATQLVVLPMQGNMKALFVLGDTDRVTEKLEQARWEEVVVTLPKFEIETTLGNGELVDYLKATGAEIAFTEEADFSAMSDVPWRIDDIIQKSKVKVDEDGIEAAAVTAIVMRATGAVADPPQPKEFTADRPFSFYIYNDQGEAPELLFFGRYVK